MRWVAWQLFARALGTDNGSRNSIYNNQLALWTDDTSVSNMDTTLQQSCALARNNGVVVFGIAFEAPTNGQNQIRGCASSVSHYFNAAGLQIQSVFQAIANQIVTLRLTQ
jgi:hypothetical protein